MKNKKTILIAEDEKALARVLKLKIEKEGFGAEVVVNGEEAIEKIKKDKPNLILLDLIMPVMDGFTVLEKMKKMGNETPVFVLSNLGQDSDIEKAEKLGAEDFFIKSDISISKVIERIKKELGA